MRTAILALAALLSCAARPAFAQLVSHADAPSRIGHYHLNVTSIEAHKKFWADTLGGRAMKFGDIDVIEFPDAFIFLRVQRPAGPTRGTAFDHIGFAVPDVPAMATRLAGAGYQEPPGGSRGRVSRRQRRRVPRQCMDALRIFLALMG
jgi:catechol 2,3-dioxygenase-like lactoylglutathione lyase family enzyme